MRPPDLLNELQETVIHCRKCPRLVMHLQDVSMHKPRRFKEWEYWSRPLPSFGDAGARLLIVGLAPAAHGGNRTGRMFTGDRSGEWLFGALHHFGFANLPNSSRRDDGLALSDCYITATIRCAPPKNKPLPEEIENCRPYFLRELELLKRITVILTLGRIAFVETLRSLRRTGRQLPALAFGHGRTYPLPGGPTIIVTYHPSQQNTQTGKLTRAMFMTIFEAVKKQLEPTDGSIRPRGLR
jgi:uracil-DNA glycosylase